MGIESKQLYITFFWIFSISRRIISFYSFGTVSQDYRFKIKIMLFLLIFIKIIFVHHLIAILNCKFPKVPLELGSGVLPGVLAVRSERRSLTTGEKEREEGGGEVGLGGNHLRAGTILTTNI